MTDQLFPPPWEQPGYGDIEAAERRGDAIRVRFANGDVIELDAELLGISDPAFTLAPAHEPATALVITTEEADREIDWMVLRSATNAGFAQILRDRDADESRRIARRLKALRENLGIRQRDAAQLAGMQAQQLARLERGETDMRLSTVQALLRAMGASFADIAGPDAPEVSTKELVKRASLAGVPRAIADRLVAAFGPHDLPKALARAFGWSLEAILRGALDPPTAVAGVRFKSGAKSDPRDSALVPLARSVSGFVAAVYERPGDHRVPDDPSQLRAAIVREHGEVTLGSLLSWAWDAGLIVIPMWARGVFSAATWLVADAPVIVLKESRDLAVYWLFDLAHELGHIARGHVTNAGVVDGQPTSPDTADDEEREANAYALDLLVPGHEQLIAEVKRRSEGEDAHKRFKFKVEDVAAEAGLSPGLLGIVSAFALPDVAEEKDRWGSAVNLSAADGPGREVAERYFRERVDLEKLPALDAALVRTVTLD